MTAAPATTLNDTYQFFRIGNEDLTALFARAAGHIPIEHLTVSTVHSSIRREKPSLSDLIADVTTASGYDNHVPWDNLEFEAKDPNGEVEVRIDITTTRIKVAVTGTNEILVRGQQARIEMFLSNRGAKKGNRPRTVELMLGITTAALFWNPAPMAPLLATFMAVTFVISLYNGRTKLKILESFPRGTTWSRFTSIEKATMIGLYVTALGIVGTVASGAVDVAGFLKK
ncbi:hypothetical protein ACFXKS_35185 [Streptomyces scopuliridis]|uniref:hypothetical protein n=1 Tax=Streptomyces scopuliridis TaxID=452529 RepID=UPI003682F7DB